MTTLRTGTSARPALRAIVSAIAVAACSVAGAAPPRALAPNHPFVGTWTYIFPGDGCVETFVIRPDGTTLITSGDEAVETQIDVSDRPDAQGAYRLDDKVVRGNGKLDCGASVTPMGRTGTQWLRFDPAGERMALCFDAALQRCFGPYRRDRMPGNASTRL